MCRKIFTGLVLLGLGSYLWWGTSVGSYARTGFHQAKSYVKGQVPVEFQIERARQLVRELVPNIQKTVRAIATEEVRVGRLRHEIEVAEANLEREKVAIQSLKEQLAKGTVSYAIGGRTYSADAVKAELNRRFNAFRRCEETLSARRELLASREAALGAAREQYERLLTARQELESELAALEARHKLIAAKKATLKFHFDSDKLSQVREAISEITELLDVEERVAESEGTTVHHIPVEEIAPADLTEQIDRYFNNRKPTISGATL
jgi:DNA repair exonuclease SbcCD ATPase subunit